MSGFFRINIHAPKREEMLSFLPLTQIFLITCDVPTDILLPFFSPHAPWMLSLDSSHVYP